MTLFFVIFITNSSYKNNISFRNLEPKIVAISYSNEIYQKQLKCNKKAAFEIGKVDEFYGYGPEDIDPEFREKNKDILSRKRGNGYWLWKPYFILKTLKEHLNYGDFLFYSDACIILKDDIRILIKFLNEKNSDMWLLRSVHEEREYAKRDAFILMGADNAFYTNTRSYQASIQIYRKTEIIERFLEDLLYYSQDKRIITDDPNTLGLSNYPEFIDNRHDQTILSILTKKYGFANSGKPNMNITELNNIPETFPHIICHYRRMKFFDYDDLLKKCKIKK